MRPSSPQPIEFSHACAKENTQKQSNIHTGIRAKQTRYQFEL